MLVGHEIAKIYCGRLNVEKKFTGIIELRLTKTP